MISDRARNNGVPMSPKTHQVFRGNFVIAVWLSIATIAYQFADNVCHAHQIIARFGWSGKDLKILLAPEPFGIYCRLSAPSGIF